VKPAPQRSVQVALGEKKKAARQLTDCPMCA